MTQSFEESIARGKAHWITSVVYEPACSRLVIRLTDSEVSFKPTRALGFTEIQQIESRWIDQDEGSMEGLLGAHEEARAGLIRYLLVTDKREIELTTRRKAEITSNPP